MLKVTFYITSSVKKVSGDGSLPEGLAHTIQGRLFLARSSLRYNNSRMGSDDFALPKLGMGCAPLGEKFMSVSEEGA